MIYIKLFWSFFKIGLFTFGGGYAMIPLINEEVANEGWIQMEQLINFIAVSESTPGPFAVNISTYIGEQTGDILGAVCATIGVVLPSFLIIMCVAKFYLKFKSNKLVSSSLFGIKPAVIGLIGSAVLTIGQTVFFPYGFVIDQIYTYTFICSLIIFIIMFILSLKKVGAIPIIILSALLGIAMGYLEMFIRQ